MRVVRRPRGQGTSAGIPACHAVRDLQAARGTTLTEEAGDVTSHGASQDDVHDGDAPGVTPRSYLGRDVGRDDMHVGARIEQ